MENRLKEIVQYTGLSSNAFASKCAIDPSNLSKMVKGQQTISKSTIRKVITTFPEVNADWLLTGDGEMLMDVHEPEAGTSDERGNYRMVPLINIDSVGGMHSPNELELSEQYIIKMMPFTEAREGDVAILQSGTSMCPTIPPGAVLLLRQVEDWQEYFGYGNIYVLLLRDGRRITKEVRRYDEDPKNYVWCVSYNPDVADEELPRKLIRGVWKVVKYVADFGW